MRFYPNAFRSHSSPLSLLLCVSFVLIFAWLCVSRVSTLNHHKIKTMNVSTSSFELCCSLYMYRIRNIFSERIREWVRENDREKINEYKNKGRKLPRPIIALFLVVNWLSRHRETGCWNMKNRPYAKEPQSKKNQQQQQQTAKATEKNTHTNKLQSKR